MPDAKNESIIRKIFYFFLISHGLPFLVTAILMLLEKSFFISTPGFGTVLYLGMLSPTIAAIFIVYYFCDQTQRKDYWKSVIDFRRIKWQWVVIIITFPILLRLLAAIFAPLFTTSGFDFNLSSNMTIPYALMLFFFGPLPEELGWRGVALPLLNKKWGFSAAVLFLGFMWSIWHLPLFFVEGTYQYQLGLGSGLFWNYMVAVLFTSVVYGFIYFGTNRSILAVILFHYFGNL
ncbi:MAG: CPBP family intramembrane metalloprotease, partial [Candidatus Cloacimonetes bacterium]|nr:CPBP family intramembrane metalloprotease [Candidatus Cloacimonadota bacterium]